MKNLSVLALCLPLLAACGGSKHGVENPPPPPPPADEGDESSGEPNVPDRPVADVQPPTGCPGSPPSGFGPFILDADEAAERWMIYEKQIENVVSSAEHPVEVCGIQGQVTWLLGVTCPDGSHPHTDPEAAHASRLGSVGPGGRCGSILDLYPVDCGATSYEVYMDMYMCTAEEAPIGFPLFF